MTYWKTFAFLWFEEDKFESFWEDGMLSHYSNIDCDMQGDRLRGKWMGRWGPFTWPPRLPHLILYDFLCTFFVILQFLLRQQYTLHFIIRVYHLILTFSTLWFLREHTSSFV
jgi:hypothetical protein